MAYSLDDLLVIGISSRALFDLEHENLLFQDKGLNAFRCHQIANEHVILEPGVAFPLVKALLHLNTLRTQRRVEVVIMSRNSSETSLRIFNSIRHYGLDISRAALTGGAPLAPYLKAFQVGLFLSFDEQDVQAAVNCGIAAAKLYQSAQKADEYEQIRIAFDGDAVLFSDESERIYQEHGLEAFERHEREKANQPLAEGPFAKLLKTLASIQREGTGDHQSAPPLRTALVTARSSPAHERVIRTLRAWDVVIDETFFMGGIHKSAVLEAFRPHMFFDDQHTHCERASTVVPTGRVPTKT